MFRQHYEKMYNLARSIHMYIAEIRTVAKLLPLLRKNTHKSLILSYSEYLGSAGDRWFRACGAKLAKLE